MATLFIICMLISTLLKIKQNKIEYNYSKLNLFANIDLQ